MTDRPTDEPGQNQSTTDIDHRVAGIEKMLEKLSGQHDSLFAQIPYDIMRKRVFRRYVIVILMIWLMLFTPVGSFFGITGLWGHLIEHAAIAMNPACQPPPGGEPCTPGSPAYNAYVEAAERARGSLIAANRNLITVLLPLLIGIVIWVITTVAERKLKTYDETIENVRRQISEQLKESRDDIEKIRGEVRDAPDQIKQKLDEEIKRLIQKSLDEATIAINKASDQRQNTIEEIRNELEERFKDLRPLPHGTDDVSLNSVGALHKRVTELFGKKDIAEHATAVSLTRMAFARARPYKS